jgi:hypothetical protein
VGRIEVGPGVLEYANRKGKRNIMVCGDIPFGSCSRCSGKNSYFTTCVKLSGKNPYKYFDLLETIGGVSIWSEKALAARIESSGYTRIFLKKGLLKGLTIEFGAELIGRL